MGRVGAYDIHIMTIDDGDRSAPQTAQYVMGRDHCLSILCRHFNLRVPPDL
jgi:hypothetical protein